MQNDFANTAQTRRQSDSKVLEIPDQSEAADENLGRQTSDISERLIRLHNEEIKLVEDKLALLKENLADQISTPVDVLRAEAELTGLKRKRALQQGDRVVVERLFDHEIQYFEHLLSKVGAG